MIGSGGGEVGADGSMDQEEKEKTTPNRTRRRRERGRRRRERLMVKTRDIGRAGG